MARTVLVMLIVVFLSVQIASAQDCGVVTCTPTPTPTPSETPTPTITPTPTNTPTPTPDLFLVWTLPAPEGTPGTPVPPGQAVAFIYSIDAGQGVIAGLLFALLVSMWVFFLFWRLKR